MQAVVDIVVANPNAGRKVAVVAKDQWGHEVARGNAGKGANEGHRVIVATTVIVDHVVHAVPKDQREKKAVRDLVDTMVAMEHKVRLENAIITAILGHKVLVVKGVVMEKEAALEKRAVREKEVLGGFKGTQVLRAVKARKARKDMTGQRAFRAHREKKGYEGHKVKRVKMAIKEQQDIVVVMVIEENVGFKARKEQEIAGSRGT